MYHQKYSAIIMLGNSDYKKTVFIDSKNESSGEFTSGSSGIASEFKSKNEPYGESTTEIPSSQQPIRYQFYQIFLISGFLL